MEQALELPKGDIPENQVKSIIATLDAALWLESLTKNGLIRKWGKSPTRYFVPTTTGASRFALTFDDDGSFALAVFDTPTLQWFHDLPWTKGLVNLTSKPAMLTFVCAPVDTAGLEVGIEQLPMFAIDLAGTQNLFKLLEGCSEIRIGRFSFSAENQIVCNLDGSERAIPVQIKSMRKEVNKNG